jgi:hypothetical protein
MRIYAADVPVLAPIARVLCRCASSAAMQQLLLKEKGLGSMLLATAATHAKEAAIITPLADLIMNLSRHAKGAGQLAGDGMVSLTKELLVNFLVRRLLSLMCHAALCCHMGMTSLAKHA